MAVSNARALSQNQLQFSLSSRPRRDVDRLAFTFRKPAPVVIERLSARQTETRKRDVVVSDDFTAISRGRLEEALFLARRDLQSGRNRNGMRECHDYQMADRETERAKQRREKSRGTASVGACDSAESVTRAVRREHTRKEAVGHTAEKTRGRTMTDVTAWENATLTAGSRARGSRRTTGSTGQALSEDEKQAVEIFRLRKQLQEELIKLKTVGAAKLSKQSGRRHASASKSRRMIFDEETDAVDLRAAVKAEEQAARSARMLYVLQRQVHEMQDELERRSSQPWKVSHTKKSRSLFQLAAAHRAAVRAIQTFVQAGEKHSYTSLTGMHQELAFLIRQLSQCCSQMNVGGSDVVNEMEDMLRHISTGECQKRDKDSDKRIDSLRISESRRDDWNSGGYSDRSTQQSTANESKRQPAAGQCLQAVERNGGVKAGMDITRRTKRHRRHFHLHPKHTRSEDRRVMLPLQPKQVLVSHPWVVSGQFADHTVASRMKRKVQGTGKEIRQTKAQKKKGKRVRRGLDPVEIDENKEDQSESRDETRALKEKLQEMMEREAARQSWLDGETLKQVAEINELRRDERRRLDELRNEMERKRTVELVVDHADRLPSAQRTMVTVGHATKGREETLLSKLSTKAVETALSNADILTETILDDLLLETAHELSRIDSLAELDVAAENLTALPTVEGLKQRIDAFELTERDIRRRWLNVKFEDEHHHPHRPNSESRVLADSTIAAAERVSDGLPQQEVRLTAFHSNRQLPRLQNETSHLYDINIDDAVLESIGLQQQDYSRHLRQTATYPSGNFNPWELAER